MIKSRYRFTVCFSAQVIAIVMAAFTAQPAAAQTAGNLKCNGCVGTKDLKKNAVKTNRIRNNAVTGAKVRNSSLTALDLGDESGADFDGGTGTSLVQLPLTDLDVVYRSVAISAPAAGVIIVNAGGYFSGIGSGQGTCSISTGSTVENASLISGGLNGSVALFNIPFAITRGFEAAAGDFVANLVCNKAGTVTLVSPVLTATYFPTRY